MWPRERPRSFGPGPTGLKTLEQRIADVRSLRLQPAPDEGLAASAAIGVGGVEDIDSPVQRAVHQIARLRFVLAHAVEGRRGSDAAEIAASQREAGNLQPGGSEPFVVHRHRAYSDSRRSA